MRFKIAGFSIVWYAYMMILTVASLISSFSSISNYNAFVLLFFSLCYLFVDRKNGMAIKTVYIAICIILTGVLFSAKMMYILIDCATVFFVLTSLDIGSKAKVTERQFQIYKASCLTLILLLLAGTLYRGFYMFVGDTDIRYGGLFNAVNFSSNVFAILEICFWELCKRKQSYKDSFWIPAILFTALIYYMNVSGTRSLLFCVPYWGYQMFNGLNRFRTRKIIICIGVIAIITLIPLILNILTSKLRFQEGEASMATRATLYLALLEGIAENKILIPHGSHSALEMIVAFTEDETFSPHNDYLSFLYDWGAIFILFLAVIYRKLRKAHLLNLNIILIILAFSSFALHNMLFSVFEWIPMTLILIINNQVNNPSMKERQPKVHSCIERNLRVPSVTS